MTAGSVAAAVGRGLFAGLAGTAIMTVSSTVEMMLRERESSAAPAEAVSKVLGLEFKSDEDKERFGQIVHWGYGTGWGAVRGLLDALGIGGASATIVHFSAVWSAALVMLPSLDVAPPVTEWGGEEIAIDGFHHLVYAVATGVAYRLLRGNETQL
jgi:hypothetical protein